MYFKSWLTTKMFKFSMSQFILRIPQDVCLDNLNSRCFRLILWPSPHNWSRKWFPCVFFIHTNPHSVTSMDAGLQSTKTNTETDRIRLQSGLYHFDNRFFCPSFLVFPCLPPPVDVVLVVFTSLLSHIQMASLCLFVWVNAKAKVLICVSNSSDHYSSCPKFPTHVVEKSHDLNRKKEERKRLSLAGSPRLTILQLLCTEQQNVGNEVWKIPRVDAAGSFGLWRQNKQNLSERKIQTLVLWDILC